LDLPRVVGQDQVRFSRVSLVANVHVEEGAGDVAPPAVPGLPGAALPVSPLPVGMLAGLRAAAPVVVLGRPFPAVGGVARPVGMVAALPVVLPVRQEQGVGVGVRDFAERPPSGNPKELGQECSRTQVVPPPAGLG
jgi:hypothetical protein